MSENYNDVPLIKTDRAFEFHIDGSVAFINYRQVADSLTLIHTEVPEKIGGRGVAAALVKRTLEYALANGLKVVPRCSYVAGYLKKHPEWNGIVAK